MRVIKLATPLFGLALLLVSTTSAWAWDGSSITATASCAPGEVVVNGTLMNNGGVNQGTLVFAMGSFEATAPWTWTPGKAASQELGKIEPSKLNGPGSYKVALKEDTSVNATVTVTAHPAACPTVAVAAVTTPGAGSGSQLAVTGSPLVPLALMGLGLLALGGFFVFYLGSSRRRSSAG